MLISLARLSLDRVGLSRRRRSPEPRPTPPPSQLVVNADDFGMCAGVNEGIARAHEEGIVTSASLMVLRDGAPEAADYARRHPALGVGLHLEFGEWRREKGRWVLDSMVVPLDDREALARETDRQIALFRGLVGRSPTHMDSHRHVHLHEPARSVILERARDLGVPVRRCSGGARYCGSFYGQDADGSTHPDWISVSSLLRILGHLAPGVTELGCHPGRTDDEAGSYREEREVELAALCDPQVRRFIASRGIELCSYESVRMRRQLTRAREARA